MCEESLIYATIAIASISVNIMAIITLYSQNKLLDKTMIDNCKLHYENLLLRNANEILKKRKS